MNGLRRHKGWTKSECQLAHTRKRLLSRYGLCLSISDIRVLAKKIRSAIDNPGVTIPRCLGRQSNRLTIWAIPYSYSILTLVYDKKRGTIVTALPKNTGLPGGPPIKALDWKRFEDKEEVTA